MVTSVHLEAEEQGPAKTRKAGRSKDWNWTSPRLEIWTASARGQKNEEDAF